MRRIIAVLAALVGMLVIVPRADAHYVIDQQATCARVGNVPTITASANLVEFGSVDQDVHITVGVDSAVPIDQRFPYAPATEPWTASTPSTAGDHSVYIYITWKHNGTPYDSSYGPTTVTCPSPVPPPVMCNGVPVPPGTNCTTPPVVVCNGVTMPPGTPPASCVKPPRKPCGCTPKPPVRCVPGHYRITVTPRHALHGPVTFRLIGPHSRHVRWYVDHVRHGVRGHAWEHVSHHGRRWWIYLWVQDVWGRDLWGRHNVTVTFTTPCGRRKLKVSYFNHDPVSPAAQRELAHAMG
jgi:hypothetical protein